VLCVENVAWVWLSVEKLFRCALLRDRQQRFVHGVGQEHAVHEVKVGGLGGVADELLCLSNTFCEVRCRGLDRSHASVQLPKCLCIVNRRATPIGSWFVVGPEGDVEAVPLIHAWFHPSVEWRDGAVGFGEPFGELDLELCLMFVLSDSGKSITGPQAQCEPVRVVEDDSLVGRQAKVAGGRSGRSHRAPDFRFVHERTPYGTPSTSPSPARATASGLRGCMHVIPASDHRQVSCSVVAGGSGTTILVVDNDAGIRTSLADILRSRGYLVIEAADGIAARNALDEDGIDLMVLDLSLPLLSGQDLLESLDDPPPVIVVSGSDYYKEDEARRRFEHKVAAFFRKPAHPLELVKAVADIVSY